MRVTVRVRLRDSMPATPAHESLRGKAERPSPLGRMTQKAQLGTDSAFSANDEVEALHGKTGQAALLQEKGPDAGIRIKMELPTPRVGMPEP